MFWKMFAKTIKHALNSSTTVDNAFKCLSKKMFFLHVYEFPLYM